MESKRWTGLGPKMHGVDKQAVVVWPEEPKETGPFIAPTVVAYYTPGTDELEMIPGLERARDQVAADIRALQGRGPKYE